MRTVARVFMVLFCLTFLANQARSLDAETAKLGKIVGKLLVYTVKGVNFARAKTVENEKRLELVEARLSAVEAHIEEKTSYERPEIPEKAAEYGGALIRTALKQQEYEEAHKDLFDFFEGVGQ